MKRHTVLDVLDAREHHDEPLEAEASASMRHTSESAEINVPTRQTAYEWVVRNVPFQSGLVHLEFVHPLDQQVRIRNTYVCVGHPVSWLRHLRMLPPIISPTPGTSKSKQSLCAYSHRRKMISIHVLVVLGQRGHVEGLDFFREVHDKHGLPLCITI